MEVDKQKMDALQFLAETNMKIGEARTLLIKLQETETEYLVSRESKSLARIQAVLDSSKEILAESAGNYEKVKEFYDLVCGFASLLAKAHEEWERFEEASKERLAQEDSRLRSIEEEQAQVKQQIKVDRIKIENQTKSLEKREAQLLNDMRKVASDRGALDREIIRIKQGKV